MVRYTRYPARQRSISPSACPTPRSASAVQDTRPAPATPSARSPLLCGAEGLEEGETVIAEEMNREVLGAEDVSSHITGDQI